MADFSGTNAVVTGASSGIGRAIAIALAHAGVDRLLVHYCNNEAGAIETAASARAHGSEVFLQAADLSSPTDVKRLSQAAWESLGTIQSWVNNAGADVLTGATSELDFDDKLRLLMNVDVLGTIALSRLVSRRLLDQKLDLPPSMTFIGWDQAPLGMEGDAGQLFGPVKSAVMAYAASLAQSVAPEMRVNTVAPGWIQTKWGDSTSKYWDDRAKSQSLMGRWGSADDVAKTVLHAADPLNTFCAGQVLNVNGGWRRTF